MENYNNIIVTNHGGLQCDNPNCDWTDETISFEELENWLNKPCPRCGANLLTQEDYDGLLELRASFELINSIPPELLEKLGENVDPEMLKELPMFKDAEGLELLNKDAEGGLNIELNTHNGIKVEKIEKKDEES